MYLYTHTHIYIYVCVCAYLFIYLFINLYIFIYLFLPLAPSLICIYLYVYFFYFFWNIFFYVFIYYLFLLHAQKSPIIIINMNQPYSRWWTSFWSLPSEGVLTYSDSNWKLLVIQKHPTGCTVHKTILQMVVKRVVAVNSVVKNASKPWKETTIIALVAHTSITW